MLKYLVLFVLASGLSFLLTPLVRSISTRPWATKFMKENPEERLRMGAAGRGKVLADFDERIIFEKTYDVYRELLPNLPAND